jgi:hypothetical protein
MYYPKNQIETNLYSNGKLLVKSTSLPYTGFYFSTYDGKYFSGNEPNDGDNIALITKSPRRPGINEESDSPSNIFTPDLRFERGQNLGYSNITNKNPKNILYSPVFQYPNPTPTEIADGEFRRYIVKKSNENIYYEVSKRNFNNSINSTLYFPLLLPWIIKGDRETVQTQNIKQVVLIEQNLQVRGLSAYLKYNFLKFYQGR